MIPPRSILAAVDFSESSRTALRLAARLARRSGAALHVLHVEDPLLVAAAGQMGRDLTAEARNELKRFIDSAPEVALCHPCCDVVVGGPAHAILRTAERENADLLVLSSTALSGVSRQPFGAVTQQLFLQATRPLVVVPATWTLPCDTTDPGLGPVIVGFHGSECAIVAARAASRLAAVLSTTVEAVHVIPNLAVPDLWKTIAERALADRVALAQRDIAQFARLTVPAIKTLMVKVGDVAEQLVLAAQPDGGRRPLLVLGRQEPGPSDDVPGAIAQRVAAIARVPLLMFLEPRE